MQGGVGLRLPSCPYADRIGRDIRFELYTTSIPRYVNAPFEIDAPFGHFVGWKFRRGDGGWEVRDYFESNSNLRLIHLGIASEDQAREILGFVGEARSFRYLMGNAEGRPPAAKTVFGDYRTGDYATIHYSMGDGEYHNQYCGNVGAVAALAFAAAGDGDAAWNVVRSLAAAFDPGVGVWEWYHNDGRGDGSDGSSGRPARTC